MINLSCGYILEEANFQSHILFCGKLSPAKIFIFDLKINQLNNTALNFV